MDNLFYELTWYNALGVLFIGYILYKYLFLRYLTIIGIGLYVAINPSFQIVLTLVITGIIWFIYHENKESNLQRKYQGLYEYGEFNKIPDKWLEYCISQKYPYNTYHNGAKVDERFNYLRKKYGEYIKE